MHTPMSSAETTELKLQSTPTGGLDASHSPYFRRLLSAGYKGYLQGTIGGASLYGAFGLVIGGIIAAPLLISSTLTLGPALALAAAFGGAGLVKGATTFGHIGSTAAINAEAADLSEQRRYLLDRYYDLPEGPEGDRQAEAIRQELIRERETRDKAPPLFHWQTALIGAVIGAVLVLGVMYFAAPAISGTLITETLESLFHVTLSSSTASSLASLGSAGATALATFGGALAGSTLGINRYYVRKWFDQTEGVVHGSSHKESALIARSEQIARLREAARADAQTKTEITNKLEAPDAHATQAQTLATMAPRDALNTPPVASLNAENDNTPRTKITASDATLQKRLADIQHAMEIPAI